MNDAIKNYLVDRLEWLASGCELEVPARPDCMFEIPQAEVSRILDDFDLAVLSHARSKRNIAERLRVGLTSFAAIALSAAYALSVPAGGHLTFPYIAAATVAADKSAKELSDRFARNFDASLAAMVCSAESEFQKHLAHCLVCGENLDDSTYICQDCGAVYHPDCYEFNGTCARYGCPSQKRRSSAKTGKPYEDDVSLEKYLESLSADLSRVNL